MRKHEFLHVQDWDTLLHPKITSGVALLKDISSSVLPAILICTEVGAGGSHNSKTSKKHIKQEGSDNENVPPLSTKHVRTGQLFDLQAFLLEEHQHWEKFERQMLQQMAQSSDDYRKSTDDNGKFQNNFLTLLECTFKPKN
ncbi:hypothetical protein B0H14DRAFT_2591533 [Mycena olivaceomarginata]|nr:hypothetical protein B0H14DRAFT_2591533 [Mycena olivaceomarginata]